MVRGAELRIAETRAVNRALRKAYGIGLCSVEELGAFSSPPRSSAVPPPSNGSILQRFGQRPAPAPGSALPFDPPVQPRCESREGSTRRTSAAPQTLSGASRELVESFISHLAAAAKQNRDALVCKLNSYAQHCGGKIMRRHIPGLHSGQQDLVSNLDGLFLVRVERASYRWHPQKPFFALRFGILEPTSHEALSFSGRLYCTERALWKLRWFLRDFGYDTELLTRDQVDEKALLNLRGVIRTSFTSLNGHSYQNLDAFAPAAEWEALSCTSSNQDGRESSQDEL